MTLVGVFPLDVHTLSGGFVHLNRPWIGSGNGQNARFFGLNAPHFPSWSGLYGLVGHTRSMTSGAQSCSRRPQIAQLHPQFGAGMPESCAGEPENDG